MTKYLEPTELFRPVKERRAPLTQRERAAALGAAADSLGYNLLDELVLAVWQGNNSPADVEKRAAVRAKVTALITELEASK